MMKENKLRRILREGRTSVSTRLWSTWPIYTEVLGTGGIMIPWAVITALLGDYSLALKLFVLYLVITIIRNIIEPKIVGSQLGLHPVVTLASMFAGVQLAGVVGLFGFPIGLSLMKHLNDTGTIEIFKRPDQS